MYSLISLIAVIFTAFTPKINNQTPEEKTHKTLIEWLDSVNIQNSNQGLEILSDNDIIEILSDVYNPHERAVNDKYFNISRRICPDSAKLFHYYYNQRRRDFLSVTDPIIFGHRLDLDQSQAILFKMDELFYLAAESFKKQDYKSFEDFENTGFLVYFTNYGPNGRIQGNSIVDRYISSVVIQFAQDLTPQTPNEWQVIPNEMYNYGDLKPPKLISNEQVLDQYTTTFNCPRGSGE